ncbi:MAG: CotH kinase family protein, partial [Clostridia bacterium]|nr:CotH kinase family protein [Clostridia bacterium]
MKTKILKSILAAFLVASFIIAPTVLGDAPRALTAHAADDVPVVRIDKTYLTAGEALSVDNPADLTLEYYVGEQKIETDSLVLSEEYFENWITVRGYDGDGNSYEDSAYFAKLPVIYIGTDDGRPVTSKLAYKPGTMFVQNNTASESVEYNGAIQIKGRGNTSWTMPKKPYRIKLDKKADLFGLGANKNWVLISNYLDESLLRNNT